MPGPLFRFGPSSRAEGESGALVDRTTTVIRGRRCVRTLSDSSMASPPDTGVSRGRRTPTAMQPGRCRRQRAPRKASVRRPREEARGLPEGCDEARRASRPACARQEIQGCSRRKVPRPDTSLRQQGKTSWRQVPQHPASTHSAAALDSRQNLSASGHSERAVESRCTTRVARPA